jgi:hypothetical protein
VVLRAASKAWVVLKAASRAWVVLGVASMAWDELRAASKAWVVLGAANRAWEVHMCLAGQLADVAWVFIAQEFWQHAPLAHDVEALVARPSKRRTFA